MLQAFNKKFMQVALAGKYLTPEQAEELWKQQNLAGGKSGIDRLAMDSGFMSESQVSEIESMLTVTKKIPTASAVGEIGESKTGLWDSFSNLFRTKPAAELIDIWQKFARFPFYKKSAEESYHYVFSVLRGLINVPCYYLYTYQSGTQKLILESMDLHKLEPSAPSNPEDALMMELNVLIEGKIDVLRNPDYSINFQPNHKFLSPSKEWGIDFLNIPILVDGRELIGIILAGPIYDSNSFSKSVQHLQQFSVASAASIKNIKKVDQLQSEINSLNSRIEVSRRMLGSALEADSFIKLLLDLALTATKAEAGFVAITHKSEKMMKIRAHKNLPTAFLDKINLSANDGLFEWSAEEHDILILKDYDFIAEFNIKSILAVPLVENGQLLGVFALVSFISKEMFSDFSLTILNNFVEQIRLVFKNSKLFEEFTRHYFDTLISMSQAYEFRSPFTTGHSRRVANISEAIGAELRLPEDKIHHLREAALIHDVGMCGVVDVAEGFQADFNHPFLSTSMIEIMPLSKDIINAVVAHHEWYDGWGFPQGLKGDQIPFNGSILALAEYFIEATSNSKIKKSISWPQLLEELTIRRGTQFDPVVIDALVTFIKRRQTEAGIRMIENCWHFKGQPEDICARCSAFNNSKRPCWSFQDVLCARHGDVLCHDCFIFKEWFFRIEQMLIEKADIIKNYKIQISRNDKTELVQLEGELDISAVIELYHALIQAVESGQPDILIDLRKTSRIDQYGLGILVLVERFANSKSVKFRFANPKGRT